MGNAGEVHVKVTVGDAVVEVTGARDDVLSVTKELRDLLSPSPRERPALSAPEPVDRERSQGNAMAGGEPPDHADRRQRLDAREFMNSKSPSTQVEAAVVAAFYLLEYSPEPDRPEAVGAAEIEEVFREAQRQLPSRTQQLLVDTYGAGYLKRVKAGRYVLNNVGFNLVAHNLPADE